MALSSQHLTGFLVGVGAAAAGFYAYKKNQDKVDEFLAKQGIKVPGRNAKDTSAMSLEDLVRQKEQLEDIIAEREMQATEETGKSGAEVEDQKA